MPVELTLGRNILLAISVKLLAPVGIVEPIDPRGILVLMWTPRLGHLQHGAAAKSVFLLAELERTGSTAKRTGKGIR
jgi:hypothetical protein